MSNEPYPDQEIVLVRHAETPWSLSGQHTGRTDLPLTEEGRRKAASIADRLAGRSFDRVLSSPLSRAADTAEIAGFGGDDLELRDELLEWDYGTYEGRTTADIREEDPDWVLFTHGAPDGETPERVQARVDDLVEDLCDTCAAGGNLAVFAHGHLLRALAVRWVGLPIAAGRLLRLSTGTVSTLGWKREIRVIDEWNSAWHLED